MKPAPPRVGDIYRYVTSPPPERSDRCAYWVDRIRDGWRGNKRTRGMGYEERSEHFGVYIWEQIYVLDQLLHGKEPA